MARSDNDPDGQVPMFSQSPERSELASRIQKAQQKRQVALESKNRSARQGDMTMLARGLRIAAEFVSAILVGSGIGYLIDEVAGTRPWALLGMFILGFAAGILNVTRVVAELNARTKSPEKGDDSSD